MRLLSWNVAGRVRRLAEQTERVLDHDADVVCLQEVTATTAPIWTGALSGTGLGSIVLAQPGDNATRRPLLTLVAAREPLVAAEAPVVPWPERIAIARLGELEIVNLHSPISRTAGLVKVLTHEAVHEHLARGRGPRLLCGDLNTPRREHPDGTIWTFARDQWGRLREERGERWDAAELSLLSGLDAHGFRDAFRELHGWELREVSWEWPRWGGGYRLDHLIVSREVVVSSVTYLHDWRHDGLSDHSPLVAEIRA